MQVIPCLHESGVEEDDTKETPDHHSLTKEEVAALLAEAKSGRGRLISQIQVRLCQGIPGYVCPRVIDGPVAKKAAEIGMLYVASYRKGADPDLVEQIHSIMVR